MNGQLTFGAEE